MRGISSQGDNEEVEDILCNPFPLSVSLSHMLRLWLRARRLKSRGAKCHRSLGPVTVTFDRGSASSHTWTKGGRRGAVAAEQTALWGVCVLDAASCGVDDLSNATQLCEALIRPAGRWQNALVADTMPTL